MPAQLIVKCPEHLVKVREFADRTGQRAQFEEKLEDLTKWICTPGCHVDLIEDFAPYSFYWEEWSPNCPHRNMNGGLIYHGPVDGFGDGGAPTFSVNLTPMSGWAIHT